VSRAALPTDDLNSLDVSDLLFSSFNKYVLNYKYNDFKTTATNFGINQNTFSLLHINIRSLNSYYDDLLELIHSKLDVVCVCVSETSIKENPICNISIPGYEFVLVDSSSNAGGVAMYVSTK